MRFGNQHEAGLKRANTLGAFSLAMALLCASAAPVGAEVVHLFDGEGYSSSFYTFLKGIGRDKDEDEVFSVQDGLLRVSGEHWGCLTTHEEYENYHLVAEFKWGGKTWGDRIDRARDNGILVHSQGEDGGYGGIWMHSLEVQIIEGGTGDLLVVGDKSKNFEITAESADENQGSSPLFQPWGRKQTINGGRVNWWGRDPGWKDVIDFRGARDVEKPVGEWNRLDVFAVGDTIEVYLNDVLVNRGLNVKPTKGRIQIQSEGAEILFRKFDLIPMEEE